VVDGLGLLALWVSAGVCWLAAWRVGFRRWEVLLAAAAVTSYVVGLTYYGAVLAADESAVFPSPAFLPADMINLLFYPLMLAALAIEVRRHVRVLASSVWLDCAVGSLGAAAVLAVVLRPALASDTAGSWSLVTTVSVAEPVLDLMLVAAVAGIAALRGVRMGSRWTVLAAGLLIFAATDSVYALQVANHVFVVGTPLDAGWAIGLVLMALWVDGAAGCEQPAMRETRPATGAMALAVSSVATLAGLGVLLTSTWAPVSTLAVALAGVTLLVAAVRSQVAFRLLARMADLRRLTAATDELTGLPNRQALYAEGASRLAEPQCRRQALLIMDLDKFKEVNDSLGHHAGDQLLVQVGARLREHLRGADMLARLGGDEYAVLLDDAGHDEATEVASSYAPR